MKIINLQNKYLLILFASFMWSCASKKFGRLNKNNCEVTLYNYYKLRSIRAIYDSGSKVLEIDSGFRRLNTVFNICSLIYKTDTAVMNKLSLLVLEYSNNNQTSISVILHPDSLGSGKGPIELTETSM